MFAELKNEVTLSFKLHNEGPLLINSGAAAKIHPRPDMSFVRTTRNGEETIYLPGSSIKGVFRTRYEQVMKALEQNVCDTFDAKDRKALNTCRRRIDSLENKRKLEAKNNGAAYEPLSGKVLYHKHCCEACKLFGSLSLGGRISFADAYPVGEWKLGMRHGVGIDRITGAAFPGALYDIETLEDGTFAIKCKMTNFELYQLRTILWVLEDIDEGLVTFGMGGSRGNGQMRIAGEGTVELIYKRYTSDAEVLEAPEEDNENTRFEKQRIRVCEPLKNIAALLHINTREELIGAIKSRAVM
jgi:CRISPR-associated RAMP protein (TIGR02581 family)